MIDDDLQEIMQRLDRVENLLVKKHKEPKEILISNADFIRLMNISKRTAVQWRNSKTISYSQVGGKIFYRMRDIQALLDKYHHKAFKR